MSYNANRPNITGLLYKPYCKVLDKVINCTGEHQSSFYVRKYLFAQFLNAQDRCLWCLWLIRTISYGFTNGWHLTQDSGSTQGGKAGKWFPTIISIIRDCQILQAQMVPPLSKNGLKNPNFDINRKTQ